MTTTTTDLTFPVIGYPGTHKKALDTLGFTDYDPDNPSTWTLEMRVVLQAVHAYDHRMATGYYTRGMVPKLKTNKMTYGDWAAFQELLPLAHFILNRYQSESATEDLIRGAWLAVKEQS